MVKVKVLGPGCANCKKLEEVTRAAAASLGVEAEVIKVSDIKEILAYSIFSTPGLVVNEKLVCSGRVPSSAEIQGWLGDAKQV